MQIYHTREAPSQAEHEPTDPASVKNLVDALLNAKNIPKNKDLIKKLITESVSLAEDDLDRLDLKILSAALKELKQAFDIFASSRTRRKVTIFGSARTSQDEFSYQMAEKLAKLMADEAWMTVTGGGPGIMRAGMTGAGADNAFGVGIRLPFEERSELDVPAKRVEMKYFFTRKLMLVKESDAFVSLPGGFGTLDETFEIITLMQTGKAQLAPIILLSPADSQYWEHLLEFVDNVLGKQGYISEEDCNLFTACSDVEKARDEIVRFYSNYSSMRWVRDLLVIRIKTPPDEEQLREIRQDFTDITTDGQINLIDPTEQEIAEKEELNLFRIGLKFDKVSYGRLRHFVDRINAF